MSILIICDSIIGNIAKELKGRYEEMLAKDAVERIVISRDETERLRMRKSTDKGTDIALTMSAGTRLRHGDVVSLAEKMVIINIEPEKVAVVRLKNAGLKTAVLIGHALGSLHRPVSVVGDRIILPIQSDGEIETLRRQLDPSASRVEITQELIVFEPEAGTHEH